jgi:hypothetical protein
MKRYLIHTLGSCILPPLLAALALAGSVAWLACYLAGK